MPPAAKKAKSSHPLPPSTPFDVKGKGKAKLDSKRDAMEVDEEVSDSSTGEENDDGSDEGEGGSESGDSMDTEDEIELAQQPTKSKQTLKRKRRAIPTSSFGQALTALLETSTTPTSSKPVKKDTSSDSPNLKQHVPSTSATSDSANALLALKKTNTAKRRRAEEKSEAKVQKALAGERKEKEDKNRVSDVIGGWGAESERALRKVAQRGVVKLFNVIQTAQQSGAQATSEASSIRGTGKASLPAPSAEGFGGDNKKKGKGKAQKDNAIGRGKPAALGQEDFLQSIRAGGIVSKV